MNKFHFFRCSKLKHNQYIKKGAGQVDTEGAKKGAKNEKKLLTLSANRLYILIYILLKLNINIHLKEVRCKEYNICGVFIGQIE